ncbi:LysR family transcriptional regulator [Agrococcus carbonis]|uniref:ModE molybdate transport repressor domain-containing protein n=1 Tax=Agrococcus carbonis TaxID=684552 RepID=A0A1H1ND63_9MICO|nr:LysR family transcriptional regulator [Agrococcus carbonis]SDR96872.1 ModE molybdate transport repressor domain-containing protein [Agrococcus carbonis]
MLDLHRLVLLRAVGLHGGITAAARELAYSHSAISQQLSLLEKEAGTPLLEKVGRSAQLTPAGLELVRNTEPILAALEHAEAELAASHDQPLGVVTLAVFPSIGRGVLPAALVALADAHPGLDVRVRVLDPEDAALRLVSRQVDAVVTDSYPGTQVAPTGGIHASVLGRDAVRGYLPAAHADADLERLRTLPWVMEPRASASTQWALRVCRELGFEPHVAHESSDVLFHLRMVEAGVAAAFLPDLVVRETGSRLAPSAQLPADQHRSILFLTRSGAQAHPALAVIERAIADAFAESVSRAD